MSDCASFAEAVGRAGALPFLALSLTHGAEARNLLEQTRASMEGRPWGVGVLGFVPPELQKVSYFAAGVGTNSPDKVTAQKMIDFLASAAAAAAIRKSGLEPA